MKNIFSKYITSCLTVICTLILCAPSALAAKDFNIKNAGKNYLHVDGATGNIGIGTTTPAGALTVMNGNVGIGTWAPVYPLQVNGNAQVSNLGVNDTPGLNGWNFRVAGSSWISGTTAGGGFVIGSVYTQYSPPASGAIIVGNVGIGTWEPQGKLIVSGGNVGIGSMAPGTVLDVQGTTRTTGLQLSTGPSAGYVLVSSSTGIGTWMSPSSIGAASAGWSTGTGTVYATTNTDNVGIGTSSPQTKLAILSGNVGIGTWATGGGNLIVKGGGNVGINTSWPGQTLDVYGTMRAVGVVQALQQGGNNYLFTLDAGNVSGPRLQLGQLDFSNEFFELGAWNNQNNFDNKDRDLQFYGNSITGIMLKAATGYVGIGTTTPQTGLAVTNGNVGIGTWTAAAGVDTNTLRVRTNPSAGYVLVSGSTGIGTWMAASTLASSGAASGWSTGTGTVYTTTGSNNVGIGTTTPQGALVVTNGNVGIGTWAPQFLLDVYGAGDTYISSNLGIGSVNPTQALEVVGTGKFSTGVNTPKLTNLTSNGFVKTGSGDGTLSVDTNTYPSYSSMTTNYLQKATSSSAVGNSSIVDNGNVGIGTTTPQGGFVVTNGNIGIGTWAPNSTFTFRGSQSASLVTLSADTTLSAAQYTVLVDSTSSAITITLPTAVGITGRCYRIKDWKGQSAVNNITIATTSGQTIDGAASTVISVAYQGAEFCSDGANWSIF